jgi:hypothetical protein
MFGKVHATPFFVGSIPVNRTEHAVEHQIRAMGCQTFEVGLFKPDAQGDGPVMLPRVWDADTLLRSVAWLRRQNREGRNIFCRPKGEHGLSLVDDLSFAAVTKMKRAGFEPALVVETSPGNFQAWLNHGRSLPPSLSTAVAKALAAEFDADAGAADWRHFGRLAGFTNRKEKYRDAATGLYPFVHLIEHNGGSYRRACPFVALIESELMRKREERDLATRQFATAAAPHNGSLKTIDEFRADSRYAGDGTRIDLAYAIYAASHGLPIDQIDAAIRSRDLSHKGSEKRQDDYVERTISKAMLNAENRLAERGR